MLNIINNELFIHLCKNPHSSMHIRELARVIGISPPKCLYLAEELFDMKLIRKEKVGRSILIKPALDEHFISIKKWTNLFLLLDCGLIQKISEKKPQTLILFGSYSRGEDNERSDIDIATDADIDFSLERYEKKLNRKIQIHSLAEDMPATLEDNIRQGILLDGIMI